MNRRAIPAVLLAPLLVVAIVVTTSACGTVGSMVGSSAPKPGEAPPIYGGVRVHIKDLSATSDEQAIFAASLDLPLCIVADTFLLPSTVFLNVREAVLKHMATQSPPSDS